MSFQGPDTSDEPSWGNLQRRLYIQQKLWIDAAIGPVDSELRHYEAHYEQSLPSRSEPVPLATLFDEVNAKAIVLVGDFHTLRQSRRSFLRILRRAHEPKRVLIALEYVEARHQRAVDDYLAGNLTLNDLSAKLHTIEDPLMGGWNSYVPIFEWARKSGARIIGIDPSRKSRKHRSLTYRDTFAAKCLSRAIKESHQHVFVLMGEMHLAPAHLPTALRNQGHLEDDVLTIYQHCDPLYFDLQARNLEHETEVSYIDTSHYYLLNTSPIVSQLSFLTWLDSEDWREDDHSPEEKFLAAGKLINSTFRLDASESLEAAEIFSVSDLSRVEKLLRKHDNETLVRELHRHVLNAESYVIPHEGLVYLASPSVNHAAEEATHLLRYACSGSQTPISKGDAFYHRLLEEAVGFFGSKLVNPQRKCLRTETCRQIAKSRARDIPYETKLLAKAAVAHERLMHGDRPRGFSIAHLDFRLFDQLAHVLGYQLGERMYHGFRDNRLSDEEIRKLFFADLSPTLEATNTYLELYFKLATVQLPERL